jgi:hypothetical protein
MTRQHELDAALDLYQASIKGVEQNSREHRRASLIYNAQCSEINEYYQQLELARPVLDLDEFSEEDVALLEAASNTGVTCAVVEDVAAGLGSPEGKIVISLMVTYRTGFIKEPGQALYIFEDGIGWQRRDDVQAGDPGVVW